MTRLGLLKIAVFFALFLIFAAAFFGYMFAVGDRSLESKDVQVSHSYGIIQQAKDLSSLTEGMLASQRGFMLTGKKEFMGEYEAKKKESLEHIKALRALTLDNPSQTLRIEGIEREIADYATLLEQRVPEYMAMRIKPHFLSNVENVNRSRHAILSINAALLNEEYDLLSQSMAAAEKKKSDYYRMITIGGTFAILIIFIFNAAVLYTMFRRAEAEQSLKESEDRFALAVEGTNDGIFDWDLKNDRVFYSRQFFAMLGEEKTAFTGSSLDFRRLIHPEDVTQVWQYIERYLHHEMAEYSNTFRMKHNSGRWIWVNSRAKATFDEDGIPLRMVGANTDITYMKEYQDRLKDEKQKAETASRAKSDFLAHMSHEIRTPLTAISGISEIFQRNDANLDDKQKKLVRALHTSTASLKDLVNDILDFSRIESGELEIKEEAFSLGGLFQQVVNIMSVYASEKGISFSFDDAGVRDVHFISDPMRLRQVLINLIGNGVKFTEKGSVSVRAERVTRTGGDFLSISVKDTGIGIAPENLEMIFDRFKQVDGSVSRKYGGSGLGLSISRNLLQLMAGTITVESNPGEGSVFTIFLPWREEEAGVALPAAEAPEMGEKADAPRILLVEDYEGNVVVVSYILEELGCSYDVARNGIEAVNLYNGSHYDVILMDVQMPEMDGFMATMKIREMEKERGLVRTPIIGMTAHALVGDKAKCIEVGMDAYLPKPIVEQDLKNEILLYLQDRHEAA